MLKAPWGPSLSRTLWPSTRRRALRSIPRLGYLLREFPTLSAILLAPTCVRTRRLMMYMVLPLIRLLVLFGLRVAFCSLLALPIVRGLAPCVPPRVRCLLVLDWLLVVLFVVASPTVTLSSRLWCRLSLAS